MKRTIFIGDLQGCFDEFMQLLEKLNYSPKEDELILLGDLINRGPKSMEVVSYLMEHPEIKSVMGNHEYHFIRHVGGKKKKKSFTPLVKEFGDKLPKVVKYLKRLPMFIESEKWIAVHAGLEPGKHPSSSSSKFLCTVRMLGSNGESRPWFEYYFGPKWVIFGHWSLKGLVCEKKVRGLDTGCVYGGELTAWVYPEDKFVSVSAQKMHYDPFANK